MATITRNEFDHPTRPGERDDFAVDVSEASLGRSLPQRMGGKLWAPMFAMAVMAFPAAVIIAIVRAQLLLDGAESNALAIAQLHHVGAGVMFLGFAAVFSAITFAIARILGEFRAGGGTVQETSEVDVQTLRMPPTARAMMVGMVLAMMLITVPVIIHFVAAAGFGPSEAELVDAEQLFDVLEGIRRAGVATYLVSITFGLATIVKVLRFQATRIREVAVAAD